MNLLGGLRETGDLPLFSPKGRTYSPPRRHKLHILCPAASGRSHPFRCASFSHKVNDFVGALLRRWYALRHRALCEADAASVEASRQCHSTCGVLLSSSAQVAVVSALETACTLPAQTCHRQLCLRLCPKLIFGAFSLLRKRNRKRKNEVKKIWRFIIWKRRWSAGAQAAPQ